jgi:hypothetical protein
MHCFAVRCATRPGECLAVTGSSPELGGWKRPGIKLMEQQGHRYRPGIKLMEQQGHRYRPGI